MNETLKIFNRYKIIVGILASATVVSALGVWNHNRQQHEKFLVEQKGKCQTDLHQAEKYVNNSKTLYTIYNKNKLGEKKFDIAPQQPDSNSVVGAGTSYLLIYNTPAALIPNNPRYDGSFFEKLSTQSSKDIPPPLKVTAKSFQSNQAIVISSCSPKPFAVPIENLYATTQANDFFTPPLGSF